MYDYELRNQHLEHEYKGNTVKIKELDEDNTKMADEIEVMAKV